MHFHIQFGRRRFYFSVSKMQSSFLLLALVGVALAGEPSVFLMDKLDSGMPIK